MASDNYCRNDDRMSSTDARNRARRNGRDYLANPPYKPEWGERKRIGRILQRARYPGWQFAIESGRDLLRLQAFRSNPLEPTRLQLLGPWTIPVDADEDQVFALVLDAVGSVDGPAARDLVQFIPAKERATR